MKFFLYSMDKLLKPSVQTQNKQVLQKTNTTAKLVEAVTQLHN